MVQGILLESSKDFLTVNKDGINVVALGSTTSRPIVDADGYEIGIVTSGTMSPSLGIAIGLGYVPTALSAVDSEIFIRIRNKDIAAKVVKLPFYKK